MVSISSLQMHHGMACHDHGYLSITCEGQRIDVGALLNQQLYCRGPSYRLDDGDDDDGDDVDDDDDGDDVDDDYDGDDGDDGGDGDDATAVMMQLPHSSTRDDDNP